MIVTRHLARLIVLTVFWSLLGSSRSASAANTEKILYTFSGGLDGGNPTPGLIADKNGNLYGMTGSGGAQREGTVFELQRLNGTWVEVVIHSFVAGGTDGYEPVGGLVIDNNGNLYGATQFGGTFGWGAIFELSPSANGWSENLLYSFMGGDDGGLPWNGSLVFDKQGNLYGTTGNFGVYGYGVVYELSPDSEGNWSEAVLHSFADNTTDGGGPTAVVLDSLGRLYGTTVVGGKYNAGTIFELGLVQGKWQETVLHDFADNSGDGGHADSGVTIRREALYGATEYGGPYGLGTIYSLSRQGNRPQEAILDSFTNNGMDGFAPQGVLSFDPAGHLYGTTYGGGDSGYGTVFALIHSDKGWNQKTLYSFTGGSDGGFTYSNLLRDSAGNLYGTTVCGGSSQDCSGYGVVFEILR